jgi:ABC-type phosphate/phosphonate transport system permease subunit
MPKPPRRDWTIVVLMPMLAALVVASFASLPLKWREFFTADALRSTLELLAGFAPPETGLPFLTKTFWATLETLAMSRPRHPAGRHLGLAFSLPASGRFGAAPRAAMRAVLNVLRSIPELVWASIMLIAAGLGRWAARWRWPRTPPACWVACSPTRWKTPRRCPSKACAPTAPAPLRPSSTPPCRKRCRR